MWQELMAKEDVEGAEDTGFSLLSTRSLILFQALVTTGCFIVLGGLTVWHAKLISKGETSIEAHINRCASERDWRTFRGWIWWFLSPMWSLGSIVFAFQIRDEAPSVAGEDLQEPVRFFPLAQLVPLLGPDRWTGMDFRSVYVENINTLNTIPETSWVSPKIVLHLFLVYM